MRSKTILSIAAFFTAFAVSAALANLFIPQNTNKTSTANAISALIRQDIRNGRARDGKIYRAGKEFHESFESPALAEYAEAVEQYVNASDSLDASKLPADFTIAWRKHMKAWRDYSDFLNEMKGYFKDADITNKAFCAFEKRYNYEINKTWDEVIHIGGNYGAFVE